MEHIDVDGLIRLAYEAAAGQRTWEDFASALARATHYDFVTICHDDHEGPAACLSAAHNIQPAWRARYAERYRHHNPYCTFVQGLDPAAGEISLLDDPTLQAEVARSEYYREYMAPQGIAIDATIHMCVHHDPVTRSGIVLQRRQGSDASPEVAMELGRALMPHLQTAALVQRRMAELQSAHGGLKAALDRLPHGVALLDAASKVMMLNRRAGATLDARDGLYVESGALACTEPDGSRLQEAMERATAASRDEGPSTGSVLHVRRPSRQRSYELLLCPLDDGDSLEPGMRPAAVIFISDPDNGSPLSTAEALRNTYGLTRRESQVALGVLRGETIQEIATGLELGRETVKTHLAGVYGKTGCRGQAELVRRLLLGVGALQAPLAAAE